MAKNGRPRAGEGVTEKSLKVEAVKNDGQAPAVARALGISQSAAYRHLQKPEIQNIVLEARECALKKAGITLEKVFGKVGTNLRKKGGPDQRHAIDKSLMILGEETSEPPADSMRPMVFMPVIVVNGKPLNFEVGSSENVPHVDVG